MKLIISVILTFFISTQCYTQSISNYKFNQCVVAGVDNVELFTVFELEIGDDHSSIFMTIDGADYYIPIKVISKTPTLITLRSKLDDSMFKIKIINFEVDYVEWFDVSNKPRFKFYNNLIKI